MLELPFDPPVQKIDLPEFNRQGVQVFIKREDTIHPFISGNKWRKLKYVLREARQLNKTHLVSFGGAYSNHLVALACAGAMFGFRTSAFVRGEEVNNVTLGLCKTWGMQLQFVSREDYRHKQELFDAHYGNNTNVLMIDEGGRGTLAMQGCAEILNEVKGFTHVCCAVGTGTTLAGLAISAAEKGMVAEGFCVLKNAEGIAEDVQQLLHHQTPFFMHHRFYFGGYGKADEGILQFISSFASSTGILLDQVYTAKMMLGIRTLIEEGYYQEGSKILAIHTGGLTGLLSQW